MAFSSLRARLPTSASAAFSTLASFPAAASAGWSQTIRGPNAGGAGLGLLGELRSDDNNDEDDGLRRADEALQRLCWQAGRDSEGRPIICIAASLLPDPQHVSHNRLLIHLVETLQSWVEVDYVLVLFAAGGKHYPPLSWFWGAWSSLGRPFRKNLRQLYLVHPTFFTTTLFTLATPLISPKFFRKIAYLRTLSDLAAVVPMRQILTPPEAVKANLLLESSVNLPSPASPEVFGRPLSTLMPSSEAPLPRVLVQSSAFLRRSGRLATEGLFRKSPSRGILLAVEEAFDRGSPVDLELFDDAHVAAVLIKTLFRELPAPLLGPKIYPVIRACPKDSGPALAYIKDRIVGPLAPEAKRLLGHAIYLLHDTSLQPTNQMTAANLAIVFTPNLIRSASPHEDALLFLVPDPARPGHPNSPAQQTDRPTTLGEIVRLLIEHPAEVFPQTYRATAAMAAEEKAQERQRAPSRRSGNKVISGDFFEPPLDRPESSSDEVNKARHGPDI